LPSLSSMVEMLHMQRHIQMVQLNGGERRVRGLSCRRRSEATKSRQRPPGAIRGHQKPPGATRSRQRPPGAVRGHQEPTKATRSRQRPPGAVRGHQEPTEATRSRQRPEAVSSVDWPTLRAPSQARVFVRERNESHSVKHDQQF